MRETITNLQEAQSAASAIAAPSGADGGYVEGEEEPLPEWK